MSQKTKKTKDKSAPIKTIRKSDRSRAAILAASIAEFARKGLDGARVDQIATRSKVNKNLIYLYFGSKESLFQAVLENSYRKLRAAQDERHVVSLDPVTGMQEFVRATYKGILEAPEIVALAASENVHRAIHIKRSKVIKDLFVGISVTLNDLYGRGRRAGLFRPNIDMIELYVTIVSICCHHISNQYTLSTLLEADLMSKRRLASRERHAISMILRYICKDPDRTVVKG